MEENIGYRCIICGREIPDYIDFDRDNFEDESCPFCDVHGAIEKFEIEDEDEEYTEDMDNDSYGFTDKMSKDDIDKFL